MGALERTIARARRRVAADLVLLGAGRGAAFGVCGGLLLLALDRGTALAVPGVAYPVLVAVAMAAAIGAAVMRRPTTLDIAVRLDRRLELRDRLGTGVAIRAGQARGDLAELAGLDAQRVAETVNVRPATPIRVTRVWPVALVLGALLATGVVFLPAFGAASADDPAVTTAELEAQREQIVQTIEETLEDLDEQALDTVSPEDVDTLERLAEQLAEPADDTVELARLRDESAARMEEMADRLAEDARQNLDAVEEVTRRFAGTEETVAPSREPPAELGEFLDAMRRGELDQAADRFDDLLEQQQDLPAPDREQLAQELRNLAEQVEPPQTPDDAESPDAAELERLREALEDLGVDEQTMREILDEQDATRRDEALDEALEQTGEQNPGESAADEETRRRLAEDLEAAREREQVREQADEQRERLAEALEQAADDLQEQQPDQDGQQQPQDGQTRQGTQPDQEQGREQGQQQQEQPGEGEGRESAQQVPRESPEGTPDAEQVARPEPDGEQPGEQPGDQPGDERAIEQPAPTPGEQPDMPGETPSVSELLRRMEQAREMAEGQQADSEKLREAARRLADTMTDEQRRELLEQWTGMQRDQGADRPPPSPGAGGGDPAGEEASEPPWRQANPPPSAFDDLDLRDEQLDEQIIGEWLSDAPVEGAPAASGGRAAVRRARHAAEQAIEKSVVPSRYHEIIRRYFGRLQETVETPPPAKPDGGTR